MKARRSEEFKVSQGVLIRQLLYMRLRNGLSLRIGLVIFLMALISCVVYGFIADIRWVIVGLMLIFILAPMIMAMLYISDALHPDGYFNTLPHRLSVEDTDVVVDMRVVAQEDEAVEERKRIHIPLAKLGRYYVTSSGIAVKVGERGLMIIKKESFGDTEGLLDFIRLLYPGKEQ